MIVLQSLFTDDMILLYKENPKDYTHTHTHTKLLELINLVKLHDAKITIQKSVPFL